MRTMMSWVSLSSIVGMRPIQMAISSASMEVIFMVYILYCPVMELSFQTWAIAIARLDFFMLLSVMTVAL